MTSTDSPTKRVPAQWFGLVGGLAAGAGMLLLGSPEGLSPAAWHTAAVGVLMAIWWITEAVPIPATALLPLVLFPPLGIAEIGPTAAPYANPIIFLFLGGFLIAIAMQRRGLHRRIALTIIHRIGTRPHAIVAGFAISCALLSMWVSNTATALMMLPIGLSVIELLRRNDPSAGANFATALMLVIAYACSIGGIATLIGTPPNAFLAAFMLENYGVAIGFVEWMQVGVPIAALALPIMVYLLTRVIYPIRLTEIPGGREYIQSELRELGPMSRAEKMVAAVFVGAALLWMVRPLLVPIVPGISDAGIAIGMALLLFLLPVDVRKRDFVLTWKDAEGLPWGVLILFGGGLSLASAIQDSGLAVLIGEQTARLSGWPTPVLVGIVSGTTMMLTELTSNTATTAAFLPVVASVASGLDLDPLMLAVPTALAASCAFMLPVATPPNAIVYGSGFVSIPQMARAGIWFNLIMLVLITAATFILVPLLI